MARAFGLLGLLVGLLVGLFILPLARAERMHLPEPGQIRSLNNEEPDDPTGARPDDESKEFDMPEAIGFHFEQRLGEDGTVPPNALMIARQDVRDMNGRGATRTAGITNLSWTAIGPNNIGGRTRSILIHPTQTNTMWIGSVGGGIWKSTDGGASWNFMNDFLPGLAIGCMALDPADPNVLYAGTGEGMFNSDSLPGVGILKSTNGGTTWSQIASTIPTNPDPSADAWGYVNRIAISPTDSFTMLAAVRFCVRRAVYASPRRVTTRTAPLGEGLPPSA